MNPPDETKRSKQLELNKGMMVNEMPNWAECRLWVDGPKDRVDEFFGKVIVNTDYGVELDYSILVPLNDENDYHYDTANAKWGTKWCGSDVNVVDYKQVEFQSPWSGPDEFVLTSSSLYPDLTFELTVIEAGMDFSYKNIYQDGCCSEIDGGTFLSLCEEFGYEICDKCVGVISYSCDCDSGEEVMSDEDAAVRLDNIMALVNKTI